MFERNPSISQNPSAQFSRSMRFDVEPLASNDTSSLAWQEDALCMQTDAEVFFPEKGGTTRDAKKVCAECDVKAQCLEYALANNERFGIWGGLSERDRRKIGRTAIG